MTGKSQKIILIIVLSVIGISVLAENKKKSVTVGVVFDGPSTLQSKLFQSIKTETLELISGEYDIQFDRAKAQTADYTTEGIEKAFDVLLNDTDVDIVITLGIVGSQRACLRDNYTKPVIAAYIYDYLLQDIPFKKGSSDVKNLCYISGNNLFESDIRTFRENISFNKIAILINKLFEKSSPGLINAIGQNLSAINLNYTVLSLPLDTKNISSSVTNDIDAAFLFFFTNKDSNECKSFINSLAERKIPSFSTQGIRDIEKGIMISDISEDFYMQRVRRIALDIQRILMGDDPKEIPVLFRGSKRLTINLKTAKRIGILPQWDVLAEAKLIGEEKEETGRILSLFDVVQEAMRTNLDLRVQKEVLNSGEKEVYRAWSNLLPQADVYLTGMQVKKDLADMSFGTQAEKTLAGRALINQLIFSDAAWGNVTIQKNLQNVRLNEYERIRLDLIQHVATTYLNVLRAKAFERIQKNNLMITRTNSESARYRENIGAAGPGEVYRWDSELAKNRTSVIKASVQRELAEQALNQILNRPLTESFITEEVDINDSRFITGNKKLFDLTDNPWAFEIFCNFAVNEAIEFSKEIKQLDAAIRAQERYYSSTINVFWLPNLAAQFQFDRIFDRYGTGSDFPYLKDSWNASLTMSYPLLHGGSKFIERQQASINLKKLKIERQALAQKIEQNTRYALKQSRSSRGTLKLSQKAAEAAQKNYKIINDAYTRGAVSIIELLDAQNNAIVTELLAANSVYDFLIDVMNVERIVGRFDFLYTYEEQQNWIDKFEAYYRDVIETEQ